MDNQSKENNRKELDTIINRMITHFRYRAKIDKATGTSQETIDEIEENIKFLEDLRDGKNKFGK